MRTYIVSIHYRTKTGRISQIVYRVHASDPGAARRSAAGEFLIREHDRKNRFIKVMHIHIKEEEQK